MRRFCAWLMRYLDGQSTATRWSVFSCGVQVALAFCTAAIAVSVDNVFGNTASRWLLGTSVVTFVLDLALAGCYLRTVLTDKTPQRPDKIQGSVSRGNRSVGRVDRRIAELQASVEELRNELKAINQQR